MRPWHGLRTVPPAALLLALGVAGITGCGSRRIAISPSAPTEIGRPAPTAATWRERLKINMGSARFRICAFAFNTQDELATIKSNLSSRDFVFTDLTPSAEEIAQSRATPTDLAPQWLLDRCRPDLRCDVVVYSGEFAGGFFGKSGVSLKVQEMEEAACQSRCRGLFHDPREVFLLACNTLATKSADDRTPDQYLQVLRGHGFSLADAESVVDLRYGALGPSFKESLLRIFIGVPRIYGFSSVAPTGEITAPRLHQYFQRKGDYASYLAKAARDSSPNDELLAAFKGTDLVQATGLVAHKSVVDDRGLVCRLYDDKGAVDDRLRIVYQLLGRPDFLAFVPTVEVFLSRHPPEQLGDSGRQVFRKIQALQAPRRQITELMYRLHISTLKVRMAHLAQQLGWIDSGELERLALEGVRQLLAEPVSAEVADIGCELSKYVPAGAGLRSEEIPEQFFLHWEGFELLACLAPADGRLSARMLPALADLDESVRLWAAHALARRLPLDDDVLLELARRLDDPSVGVRQRLRWIFGAQTPLSPEVLATIREHDPALAQSLAARASEAAAP